MSSVATLPVALGGRQSRARDTEVRQARGGGGGEGAPGRVRAAAEPGDRAVERAHAQLERGERVRDAHAIGVVELCRAVRQPSRDEPRVRRTWPASWRIGTARATSAKTARTESGVPMPTVSPRLTS
jgi:hypothetical protein